MNPVVHFEIPYTHAESITLFYTHVFGWKITCLGEASGNYILAQTAMQDAKPGMPAGCIDGGFFQRKEDWPMQYPSVVIAVSDIRQTIEKIIKYGGQILGEPICIPDFGWYVSFVDTEGNRNSIIEPQIMLV